MKKLSQKQKNWIEKTVSADRSYKKIVYTRFFLCALSVLLQFFVYLLGVIWLGANWWVFNIVASFIGLLFVFHIFSRTERPSSKLSWVLLIVLFPIVGVSLYLAFGGGRPMKKLLKKINAAKERNARNADDFIKGVPQPSGGVGCLLEKCGFPAYSDGEVTYYPTGKEAFAEMLFEMKKAKKYILIEYFIVAGGKMWEQMLAVLLEKAMQGVKIYILYDDFGSLLVLPPKYDKYLESLHENIRCVAFNPVLPIFSARMNNRDHRKMLIVDGEAAFTGGINLADEYIDEKVRFGYWKDSAIKVTGGGVNAFVIAFFNLYNALKPEEDVSGFLTATNGEEGEGIIQPYDDIPGDKMLVAETVFLDLIDVAKEHLYITPPYLVLDDFMRSALCRAALRGVDVRIVTPGIPDKKIVYRLTRANYEILMKAGVKIYEYTPGFIHAKNVVSDGAAVVGTVNFDYRSFYLHFENAVYFTKPEGVAAVKADCEEIFSASKLCTEQDIKRGFWGRLLDANLRVFETLM
ncbi:MAG: cardiolipin synthase [Clostridia bacterium]|nr:cardiolipin synthase [Clostridia bacterium]